MLERSHRLTRGRDFSAALRAGIRVGRPTLVLHLALPAETSVRQPRDQPRERVHPPRVGLIVGRAVGPAVTRNRVKRRLRHLAAAQLAALPAGTDLVIRALPRSAESSSARLGADLQSAIATALSRLRQSSRS